MWAAKKTRWGLVVVILVVIGMWWASRQSKEEVSREIVLEPTMMLEEELVEAMTEAEKAAIETQVTGSGSEQVSLADVTGGQVSGIAWRRYEAEAVGDETAKFYHKVEATGLPALEKGFFYEGWLVGEAGFFSTGRMAVFPDGTGILYYKALEDKSDFSSVLITLEPEDGDPAPAAHVIEGRFL